MIGGIISALIIMTTYHMFSSIASKTSAENRAAIRKWFGILSAAAVIAVIAVSFMLGALDKF